MTLTLTVCGFSVGASEGSDVNEAPNGKTGNVCFYAIEKIE